MKIALYPYEDATDCRLYVNQIIDLLKEKHTFTIHEKHLNLIDDPDVIESVYDDYKELSKNCDLLFSLGGDGTILRISEYASMYDVPVLSVNLGHMGFLTTLEKSDIHKLPEILEDELNISTRMMLNVKYIHNNEVINAPALNEVALVSGALAKMSNFEIRSFDHLVANYDADGIIISTPTGSTAYGLSAGGPIIDPSTEIICVTPICSHSRYAHPIVFSGNTSLSATGNSRRKNQGIGLSIDGKDTIILEEGTKVEVSKSDRKLKLVTVDDYRFYDIVNNKLFKY